MTDTNKPSTGNSYLESAKATLQNAVGAITGNPNDKQAAADRHRAADTERDLSKSGTSAGPFNISTSGVTTTHSDRTEGKLDQTLGSGKQFAGDLVGNKDLSNEGRKQHDKGEGKEAAGQLKDYVGGAADRVAGAVGAGVAAATGNRDKQADYERQHDTGKTNLRGAEADMKN